MGEISETKKNHLLSIASVFIHPSLSDIFALTLLEAASAGVPCIAFNVGANKEIFNDFNTEPWTGNFPIKLVTHHWSNHENKGFEIYKKIF